MSPLPRSVLIVQHPAELLSEVVAADLRRRDIRVIQMPAGRLGSRRICLERDCLYVDGQAIDGLLFRVSPDSIFSDEYGVSDQAFCDAEIRAIFLAALNLDSVLAVNRYDAVAWFEGLGWPTWRRKLLRAGIPVSDLSFGGHQTRHSDQWYPYASWQARPAPGFHATRLLGSALTETASVQSSLVVGKDIVAGARAPTICTTVKFLEEAGVYIAEIVSDLDNKILTVNTLPTFSDIQTAQLAGYHVAEMFDAHLHCG